MTLEIDFNYRPADRSDPMSTDDLELGHIRLDGEPLYLPGPADDLASRLVQAALDRLPPYRHLYDSRP